MYAQEKPLSRYLSRYLSRDLKEGREQCGYQGKSKERPRIQTETGMCIMVQEPA
jgi:hypothetical protein